MSTALDRSLAAPHLAAESRDARYGVNATILAAIAADPNISPAFKSALQPRESDLLSRWARDVDAADAAIQHCSAEHEAALISHLGGLLPGEAVVLLAVVFRGLAHNSHIDAHRDAMAGIADRDREPVEDDGPDPDEAYERSRDDAIDFPVEA